ncbi:MAG: FKBP-type peptidyl-prolyl cis-trans isomerase [Nanoarchaeota archaeon]|nr:FKBP-type peptidyl-prolyl cis-trans isomerase [Nanoarchaeota archaeon]
MVFKENDFVKVDFDIYANGKLVQTTDEKKGKEAKLDIKEYKPMTMVLGKAFVLKAIDDDIIKNGGKNNTLNLKTEEAYGKRQKDLLKVFPKSTFDEKQIRAVPGVTYDFNGMYGTVKSVIGGRVMVDFNNPLSGKDIKVDYTNVKKLDDICEKVKLVLEVILRVPQTYFDVSEKDKKVTIAVPEQLLAMKDMLSKSIEEMLGKEAMKAYTFDYKVKKIDVKNQ